MGRVELDPTDEDLDSKLRALKHRAQLFGSSVVSLEYPGSGLQIFVGTNHAYQYEVTAPPEVDSQER